MSRERVHELLGFPHSLRAHGSVIFVDGYGLSESTTMFINYDVQRNVDRIYYHVWEQP